MKVNKLFENWNKFRSGLLQEEVLEEASERFVEYAMNFLRRIGGIENLPHNKLFKGKARSVIHLGSALAPGSEIANILTWLEQQGYDTNFATGLASKEFKSYTGKPGAPDTKEVMRVKHQKIGKVLQRAADIQRKIDDLTSAQYTRRMEWFTENPDADRVSYTPEGLENDPEFKSIKQKLVKLRDEYSKHFRSGISPGRAEAFTKYWNNNSRYFRENPDEMMNDYSVIVTRHPIDVLNMSNLGDIESCHSEGNDFSHCALKEAISGAALAYLVETADLDEIDIEDEEIFEDDKHDRYVPGIVPIGRLRLRHYEKVGDFASDNKYAILLPEKREYSTTIPSFYEAVRNWSVEGQKKKWSQDLKEDGTLDANILRDFVLRGGSHQDTRAQDIFRYAFKDYGGEEFEFAEFGGWKDDEEEEKRLVRGYEQYYEEMQDLVYNLNREADNVAIPDANFVQSIEWKVVNPQVYSRTAGMVEEMPEWDEEGGSDTYEAAEAENDPSYGPYPEVAFDGTLVMRVQANGSRAQSEFDELDPREIESLGNDIWTEMNRAGMYSTYLDSYELESEEEGYYDFYMRFSGITSGADRIGLPDNYGGDERREHIEEWKDFIGEVQSAIDDLANLKAAMVSALSEDNWAKPSFSDLLQKDINEEKQKFSKFILRLDNGGGYTLTYPMYGDPLLPDDMDKDSTVVMQIPAGRMPTKEILHGAYKDVKNTGNWRVNSYSSKRFTSQVIGNMAKFFAQAHMAAKRQLNLPLQEQSEEIRELTVEDIQEYITEGFTLSLADISYEKGSGTKQSRSDFTPETGVPRKTILAVVRFVLDDEPHKNLTLKQTEELFKAAINFVKMLDEDISLLGKEVSAVLQNLSPKQESGFAKLGMYIKQFLSKVDEMTGKIDGEIFQVAKEWGTDPEKKQSLNLARLTNGEFRLPDKYTTGGEGKIELYYRHLGTAFENTYMSQFIDDRIDIVRGFRVLGRHLRSMDNPSDWSRLTPEEHKSVYDRIYKLSNQYSKLQTAEELSRLFESAPNLMSVIREEILAVLGK